MPDPVIVNKALPDEGGPFSVIKKLFDGVFARLHALEMRPTARDGSDGLNGRDGKDADPEMIRRFVAEEVAKLPPVVDGRDGVDGKDADPELIRRIAVEAVAKALAEQPKKRRITRVLKHDEKGRVIEFEQTEE